MLKFSMLLLELCRLKEAGARIPPRKVLSLIKLEEKLFGKPQIKYTDWIPLTPAEKMAEDAKHVAAPSAEELQSMKDVFDIEFDVLDDTASNSGQ